MTHRHRVRIPQDGRYCYGAQCTWFGSIGEVGTVNRSNGEEIFGLPCCPHCGGMLFELSTEAEWWKGADEFEAAGHPGYRSMLEWQKREGTCFRGDVKTLIAAYAAATKIEVKL